MISSGSLGSISRVKYDVKHGCLPLEFLLFFYIYIFYYSYSLLCSVMLCLVTKFRLSTEKEQLKETK